MKGDAGNHLAGFVRDGLGLEARMMDDGWWMVEKKCWHRNAT